MWLEPKRDRSLEHLEYGFRVKVNKLLSAMWAKGYDAVAFETLRSAKRQAWLYSIGRTRQRNRKPVTFTLRSNHQSGRAVDIISKRKGWTWPGFFAVLKGEAEKLGLHVLTFEGCHVEE
jgi:hypothetical protein